MSRYRRSLAAGGTFFFTVILADRRSQLPVEHIERLRQAWRVAQSRHPFETIAVYILPDHLYAVWSKRISAGAGTPSNGFFDRPVRRAYALHKQNCQTRKGHLATPFLGTSDPGWRGLDRHVDYVHFNPVKHGLAGRVSDWPYSSFHRYVARGVLPEDWAAGESKKSGGFGEPG